MTWVRKITSNTILINGERLNLLTMTQSNNGYIYDFQFIVVNREMGLKFADYFDVSIDYLLERTDNPKVNR